MSTESKCPFHHGATAGGTTNRGGSNTVNVATALVTTPIPLVTTT